MTRSDTGGRIGHQHVAEIFMSFNFLDVKLQSGANVMVPVDRLSPQLERATSQDRAQYLVSDDGKEITWPRIGVTLRVDDVLDEWLFRRNKDPGGPVPSANTLSVEEVEANHETNEGIDALVGAGRRERQYDQTAAGVDDALIEDLVERVERLESIIDGRSEAD